MYTTFYRSLNAQVTVHHRAYRARVLVAAWLEMVGNRFWSTFAHMTDTQLSQGLEELRALAGDNEYFSFEDRLLLLQAHTPRRPTCWHPNDRHVADVHARFAADGFVGPIDILTAEQATTALASFDRYCTAQRHVLPAGQWRFKSHLLLPWVWHLVHHPAIVKVRHRQMVLHAASGITGGAARAAV